MYVKNLLIPVIGSQYFSEAVLSSAVKTIIINNISRYLINNND